MAFINTCRPELGIGVSIAQPSVSIIPELAATTPAGGIELLIDGIADGTSGFAVHLRDWARHLAKYGVQVFIHRNSEYPEIVKMHDTKVTNPIELSIIPGGGFPPKNSDRFVIGYTVFETDTFPEYFRDNAENVDLLWCASKFCYDRFVKVGIPREKIELFPEGVDIELFNPHVLPLLRKEGKFLFGCVVGWSERKGVSVLLNAFLKEFDRSEDVALYISGGWYARENAEREVEEVKKGISKSVYPRVILDWNDRLDWEMPSLFNSFDCFVLPSKGEGYCRPVVEALSCEIPTISTDYPPMNEVLNKNNGFPIRVEKIAPEPRADWICDFYKDADFAHPSEEHLRALMREVFEHHDEAKAKAANGREYIKKKHNTSLIIEDIINRLVEIKNRAD